MIPILAQQSPPDDDIYDIVVLAPKDPVWPIYLGIALFLLVLVAVGLAIWWWRQRNQGKNIALSPESRAAKKLHHLKQQHDSLETSQFTLALSETIKDYLAEKFDDPVRFETTPEFLVRISRERSKMPDAAQQELQQFLATTEELKFGNIDIAKEQTYPLFDAASRIIDLCQAIGNDGEESH